jgi:phenylacetate-CoA ligase
MSLRSLIYSSLILPKFDAKSYAGLYANLSKGRELEGRPLAQNLESQWAKTQAMLRHAYATVPFYRERFDNHGIRPEDIRTPADLQRIPVLTRDDIRNNFERLASTDYKREDLLQAATGGTTDSPVPILRNRECIPLRNAIQAQFESWAGVNPGDKIFWLWGARIDFVENPSWRWRFYDQHLMRRMWAPTSLLNESVLADYAKRLDAFRPDAIIAYPTPLSVFCDYLLATDYKGHLPRTAICTAEPLTGEQREVIERALHCKVFELYGARDFGMVGGECEQHDGMHLNPFTIFAEILPLKDADGVSEIIATELLNFGFPLIRYRINDCVYPRSPICACGRGFPLIGKIEGRITDNFYLPNGDLVPGVSLTNRVIKTASGIKKMQVIQERLDAFVIRYVPDSAFNASSIPDLTKKFETFLGSGIQFEFTQVDEIPRERSGKTRLCISKVPPPARAARQPQPVEAD